MTLSRREFLRNAAGAAVALPTAAEILAACTKPGTTSSTDSLPYKIARPENPVTLPNQDGPIRRLDPRVSFGAVQTIEFRPTGTAYSVNPDGTSGPPLPGTGVAITLTKGTEVRSVTVNALGKIQ